MSAVPTWEEAPRSALGILKRARSLIARRGGWIKGASAETKDGWSTTTANPTAARFCAGGAISRAGRDAAVNHHQKAVMLLSSVMGGCISEFNDRTETRKVDVLRAFDRAIRLLRRSYKRRKK